jgi:hypothetical protein
MKEKENFFHLSVCLWLAYCVGTSFGSFGCGGAAGPLGWLPWALVLPIFTAQTEFWGSRNPPPLKRERYTKANRDAARTSVDKGWVGCGTIVPRSVWAQSTVLSIAHVITSHVIAFNAIGVSGHRHWACGLVRRWWCRCGSPCTYRCRCWCRYGYGGTTYRRRVIWVTVTAVAFSPSSGAALPIGGVLGVLAMLGDRVRLTWGVPTGVFGGGGHLFKCHH